MLGYRSSPDTLLRRQRDQNLAFPLPRVLGVDECALRRGMTYATLLVDLERPHPIAVLEGRPAEPLMKWLQAHPTVEILVRARADASALAGRAAAPQALQVADRFHLVRNVGEALKTLLHSSRWDPPTPAAPREGTPGGAVANVTAVSSTSPQPTPCKRALWEAVQPYRDLGQSCRQIAQAVGLDRRTVRQYLAADQPPVYPARCPRPTQLTPHLGYLADRWAQGCHNARRLYQELVQRGYQGSASMVRKGLQPWRTHPVATPKALSSTRLSRLILQPAERLREAERTTLAAVLQANPRLAQGYPLGLRFRTLLAEREVGALEPWLQEAKRADLPSFQAVARSVRQDLEAITAALTTPWSTGQCAGQICRVKLIKRLGYGRAKLDLLRQRIVHRGPGSGQSVHQDHESEQPVAA